MNLKRSNVIFIPETHSYILNGVELKGITGILKKHLFADKYDGIPRPILEQAASRGSEIHDNCQLYDMLGTTNNMIEVENYARILEENKIQMLESEYLVSDEENFATMIDKVDSDFNLYDIKTTSLLDTEYLSWQLSICAYLFELQNQELKVGKLYGLWLKDEKSKLVEIQRIDTEIILSLLTAEINNQEFENPLKEVGNSESELLQKVSELEQTIIVAETELKALQERQKEFKDRLLTMMDERGIKSWETDSLKITRKADSTRESFDSKALKEAYPEIHKEFSKTTTVKGSIIIKIK